MFFAVCAGSIEPLSAGTGGGGGAAGPGRYGEVPGFPIGCFDASGQQLGADSFVPGYTQVYAFADGRTNHNPVVLGLAIAGAEVDAGDAGPPSPARPRFPRSSAAT